MEKKWEVTVVGGGHAGIEAAHAAAALGCKTLMITMDALAIGRLSCNPAIGGVAKGQLVRDIDALGGLMGVLADRAGIQFRMLNRSKGAAVWGPRAQMDGDLYPQAAQAALQKLKNLSIVASELFRFSPQKDGGFILELKNNESIYTKALIITSGTFLGGVMYTGMQPVSGGRVGEDSAEKLALCMDDLGIRTRRLKTGTPARLHKKSIDYSLCQVQDGDVEPFPFSFRTTETLNNSAVCWITHTNLSTHDILREGFSESPMFQGKIKGVGPRYCPSIEDKINRFADKDAHQLFLEPEGLNSDRIYVNGFSSSLPAAVQDKAMRTIPGLANCQVIRYGYAVEYVAVNATDLTSSLESKNIPGLYFAGQVNGTSGYEEAAAQGLVAGINAVHKIKEKESFILARSDSYIGVMIDDLVTMDIAEPYRMFTSRAEYRLFLRHDNAEKRLMEKGYALGLVAADTWEKWNTAVHLRNTWLQHLQVTKVQPQQINPILETLGSAPISESEKLAALLKRPHVSIENLLTFCSDLAPLSQLDLLALNSELSYEGFFERQEKEIERNRNLTHLRIPEHFDFDPIPTLRIEAKQALKKHRPSTVAECAKLPSLTPADISGLIYAITHFQNAKI